MPNETENYAAVAELHENAANSYRAAAEAYDKNDVDAYNKSSALALDFARRAYDASKPMESYVAAAELHAAAAKNYRSAAEAFANGDLESYKRESALALDLARRAYEASKHAYEKTEKHHWMFI